MSHPSDQDPHVELNEDHRKHLEFIEAIIARLASSSSSVKGWALAIATATFAVSATQSAPVIAGLGVVMVVILGVLDSYYLHEEKLFRYLYDDVRKGDVEPYKMDKHLYASRSTRRQMFLSWSVFGFYVPLAVVGLISLVWLVVDWFLKSHSCF